ncbi:MAG: hypothetical protein KBT03_00235 [Bacteroidales bacterium]|nr:hypothetical protein [Candidatus Scybalousia scybalohippi]
MKKIKRKDLTHEEVCLTGRVFVEKCRHSNYGVKIISCTEFGQGWGMDLNNLTPNDLRVIADFLESED